MWTTFLTNSITAAPSTYYFRFQSSPISHKFAPVNLNVTLVEHLTLIINLTPLNPIVATWLVGLLAAWCCWSAAVIMVALWNRADHYIFILWFLSIYLLFFFPRLISAAAHSMSTILPHMVWPYCKFRMQVWNVLHAARCKYRTQKSRQKSPSGYHRTTLSGYIFPVKARIDNQKKKLLKQQYLPHMSSQYGEPAY